MKLLSLFLVAGSLFSQLSFGAPAPAKMRCGGPTQPIVNGTIDFNWDSRQWPITCEKKGNDFCISLNVPAFKMAFPNYIASSEGVEQNDFSSSCWFDAGNTITTCDQVKTGYSQYGIEFLIQRRWGARLIFMQKLVNDFGAAVYVNMSPDTRKPGFVQKNGSLDRTDCQWAVE